MTEAIGANGFLQKDMEYLDQMQKFVDATRIRAMDEFVRANRELRLGIGVFFYGATAMVAQQDGLNNLQTQYMTEHVLLMLGHSQPVAAEVAHDFVFGDIISDQIANQIYTRGASAMRRWLVEDGFSAEEALRGVLTQHE